MEKKEDIQQKIVSITSLLSSKYHVDVKEYVELRHALHQIPEIAFKETLTSEKLRKYLVSKGIPEKDIKQYCGTGFTYDIVGTGKPNASGKPMILGLRSELDGLPLKEANPDLPYQSKNDCAHACGHDGHMATLMAIAEVLLKER